MNPTVIVMSDGSIDPERIADDIVAVTGKFKKLQNVYVGRNIFPTYLCNIKTKYYETEINLVPYQGDVNNIAPEILAATEGLVVYFDSQNKSFLPQIHKLCQEFTSKNISIGLLITQRLFEDSTMGVSFKDIKSNVLFDIIELCNGEDAAGSSSQLDFKEVHHALQNHVWSNIECPQQKSTKKSGSDEELNAIEDELEMFEDLLVNIQNFKKVSSNLERNQVLDEAEKLAELFTQLINDN